MAPELFTISQHSTSTDIYALGMTLYEIAYGCRPFDGLPDSAVLTVVKDGIRPTLNVASYDEKNRFHPDTAPSQELSTLIAECWQTDPAKRPTVDQVVTRLTKLASNSNDVLTLMNKTLTTANLAAFSSAAVHGEAENHGLTPGYTKTMSIPPPPPQPQVGDRATGATVSDQTHSQTGDEEFSALGQMTPLLNGAGDNASTRPRAVTDGDGSSARNEALQNNTVRCHSLVTPPSIANQQQLAAQY